MKKHAPFWMVIFTAVLVVGLVRSAEITQAQALPEGDRITPELRLALSRANPGEGTSVIVTLQPADTRFGLTTLPASLSPGQLAQALAKQATTHQAGLRAHLDQLQAQGQVSHITPLWIVDAISLTAPASVIAEIAARPDVQSVALNRVIQMEAMPAPSTSSNPEVNINLLDAPALWELGFFGQGVVVANIDTGVDASHPDLAGGYRGGDNSWFDPYGQHTVPTDQAGASTGHGTATMSLMVGGNAGGTALGIAPQAQWIAVKGFDDNGQASITALHQSFQWLLDPDGDPDTPDAPQIISSSWGNNVPACDPTFQPDLEALRQAGILPIFSAGNYGPNTSSGVSPANLPGAFSVGAIDNLQNIVVFSSRGPNACQPGQTFPQVVAPGYSVRVAAPAGNYTYLSGTSFSAPQTAGVLALLLSAFPCTNIDLQAAALMNSAVDLGPNGPDNTYGYGMVNALAAYQYLLDPSPLPSPPPPPNLNPIYLPIIWK